MNNNYASELRHGKLRRFCVVRSCQSKAVCLQTANANELMRIMEEHARKPGQAAARPTADDRKRRREEIAAAAPASAAAGPNRPQKRTRALTAWNAYWAEQTEGVPTADQKTPAEYSAQFQALPAEEHARLQQRAEEAQAAKEAGNPTPFRTAASAREAQEAAFVPFARAERLAVVPYRQVWDLVPEMRRQLRAAARETAAREEEMDKDTEAYDQGIGGGRARATAERLGAAYEFPESTRSSPSTHHSIQVFDAYYDARKDASAIIRIPARTRSYNAELLRGGMGAGRF